MWCKERKQGDQLEGYWNNPVEIDGGSLDQRGSRGMRIGQIRGVYTSFVCFCILSKLP